ncbi:rRNA maturation RNase YbeY [Agrococcus sp. SCSIO52902]|uniref:rRNA maturation RNase YbeY n=1 Tax=Agrococcus sp. SCSIO52902 TaxID=2933290 RepID=UPI001FF6B28B|nr:rRNA maturation RNase YbeY [Agrococcus sp. SCSIO52902]UOW00633.1 rRNA maturation RNase YbeY [Agrococcus sp. SCSIO52902]
MAIDLLNETEATVDEAQLVRLVAFALEKLFVHPDADVSLVLVDVAAMEQLHVQWMDEPGPTDVLSFPMDELRPGSHDRPTPAGLLGDIVLCPEVAQAQAAEAGHSLVAELRLLTTHGLLHLLGFDHAEPADRDEMFTLQDRLLAGFEEHDRATPGRMP